MFYIFYNEYKLYKEVSLLITSDQNSLQRPLFVSNSTGPRTKGICASVLPSTSGQVTGGGSVPEGSAPLIR
jgi:hypothetical protein